MDISIFLAKALGLYLLIVGGGLVINASKVRPLLNEILSEAGLLFVTGFIALILGILLVISHNIWVTDWRVVITIVAWMAFIKGIIRVGFPQTVVSLSQKWVQNDFAYYSTSILVFLIGIFLGYHGFF